MIRLILIPVLIVLGDCSVCSSQSVGDYRSFATGTWGTRTNWERWNGAAWVTPTVGEGAPTSAVGVVTVLSPHIMTISAAVSIDQVIINAGGTVQTSGAIVLTIANGGGDDLVVNGTFTDGSSGSISWTAGSTWLMGVSGTLIKTTASAATGWQGNYSGGISTIPASANWIIRKTSAANPVITTIGAYYPNLTIENNVAGTWNTATTSTFQGNTGYPTIKGSFDIGGGGTSTVNFLNQHTFGTATLVLGNIMVRTGNTLGNYGTGITVEGNVTVDGSITNDANDGRRLIFSGGNPQSVSGAGATFQIWDLTVTKSADNVTLNRAITVTNLLTMTSGNIISTLANLITLGNAGSVTGASNASFVNGPVRYLGAAAITYPVGKGSTYKPLGVNATGGGGTFWTETFDGVNGAWTQSNTGANAASANTWYISCQEDGLTVGSCGSSCLVGNSLHLGSTTLGDVGAAYDASQTTNRRAESPTINCSGRAGITLAFTYIEFGEGATDDATLWYYNGAAWALLSNFGKAPCCGGACDGQLQGQWAAYSIALPSSADNNANVKIGFNWTNNASGGTDPSCAVDNITLTGPPVIDFTCEYFISNPQTDFGTTLSGGLTAVSSCEYWVLSRNAGSVSKSITLNWNNSACTAPSSSDALTELRVARWDGSQWTSAGNTATSGGVPPSSGSVTSSTVSTFSPFTFSTTRTLPIELLSFEGKLAGSSVDLFWKTASEVNNDFFTIDRSGDLKTFTVIENVKGAGNSNIIRQYKLTDTDPVKGINYYRLKQTDFDGRYEYFGPIAVRYGKDIKMNILSFQYANEKLFFTFEGYGETDLYVDVMDNTGKIVLKDPLRLTSGNQLIIIPVSFLSNGLYLVKVSSGKTSDGGVDGMKNIYRFIKP